MSTLFTENNLGESDQFVRFSGAEGVVNDTAFSRKSRGLYVGVGGNINLLTACGDTVLHTGVVAGTILYVNATKVIGTSTTATNLVALFS